MVFIFLDHQEYHTVRNFHHTLWGYKCIECGNMDMAQTACEQHHIAPVEQPYGQYTVHESGNSTTVTVPRALRLESGTEVNLRVGWYEGRVLYLKAVPLEAMFDQLPGTQTDPTIDTRETVTERKICTLTVRGGGTDKKELTIPDKCETSRFANETKPMVVAGTVEDGVAYLKLIPECLYAQAGSINLTDITETVSEHST
jgi:virulence-associated protein VagC